MLSRSSIDGWKMKGGQLLGRVRDVLLPPTCLSCDRLVVEQGDCVLNAGLQHGSSRNLFAP